MNSVQADLHNFGQQVTLEKDEKGCLIYRKPRPIFWEWLFFGLDSPLSSILGQDPLSTSLDYGTLAGAVFGLNVTFTDSKRGFGYSAAIEGCDEKAVSDRDMVRFGALLGYSFAFGIQDLHHENVIRTQERPQVIDAEVVLSKLILPNETFLLPFAGQGWQRVGIYKYFSEQELFLCSHAQSLLAGFVMAISVIESKAGALVSTIESELKTRAPMPIRVILRDTLKYRSGTAETAEKPLFNEEVEQLSRGDVPYFFKFLGSDSLYYYRFKNGKPCEVQIPSYFRENVKRIGFPSSELLGSTRLALELLPAGLLLLCRTLIPGDWVGEINLPRGIQVTIEQDALSLMTPAGNFAAKRKRV